MIKALVIDEIEQFLCISNWCYYL